MIYKFDELESTNKYLLVNYDKYDHLDVIYTLKQTSGRGRLGRSWVSEDSIAMSIVLKNNLNFDLGLVSFVAAAALYNIINKYTKDVSIKWPNDILIKDQKICGILCQSKITEQIECLVVGVGLNTNNELFEDELKEKATSLYILNNNKYNNEELIKQISEEFNNMYNLFVAGDKKYLNICKGHNYLLNREIEFVYENKPMNGRVVDINEKCELVVETKESTINLKTGEVLLKKSYFY